MQRKAGARRCFRVQGIHFPDNSATTEKPSEYREKFLKTIFAGYAKKSNESIDDINRTAQGLKTTMTSQPDMCVLREEDIIVGELKQASHYSVEGAQRQCAVYAYAVLYFYRVILGYPVDHAYGFWVCGPKTGGGGSEPIFDRIHQSGGTPKSWRLIPCLAVREIIQCR